MCAIIIISLIAKDYNKRSSSLKPCPLWKHSKNLLSSESTHHPYDPTKFPIETLLWELQISPYNEESELPNISEVHGNSNLIRIFMLTDYYIACANSLVSFEVSCWERQVLCFNLWFHQSQLSMYTLDSPYKITKV